MEARANPKTIVILGTLDTKGAEFRFLRDIIAKWGHHTILIDVNMGGDPTILPDITAAEIARAGGSNINDIRQSRDTGKNNEIMIRGAVVKVAELLQQGQLDGIISIGGASGTTLATTVMKALPFGIPKMMLSTTASMPEYAARYIGTKDITMMHSVVDLAGLNDLVRDVLTRAAGAICGMVDLAGGAIKINTGKRERPLVAVTEFKFSDLCCRYIRQALNERGIDMIACHAQGIGDVAMEELIDQGLFDGVLDIVPAGVGENYFGGNRDAGPHRLEAAGKRGIPQVIAPCGLDMISCGPLDRGDKGDQLWGKYHLKERQLFIPDEYRVQARVEAHELRDIARIIAGKLNQARGPVEFLIPTQGWSNLSVEGASLFDPLADRAFVDELKANLSPKIIVKELGTHLNTAEFAQQAVEALESMLLRRSDKSAAAS